MSKPLGKPWKTVRDGSVEVAIYKSGNGYRAVWYLAGERQRKFCTDSSDVLKFAKEKAAELNTPMKNDEVHRDEELRYLHQQQARIPVPIHTVIDYYLLHERQRKLVPAKVCDLWGEFLALQKESDLSPGYIESLTTYLKPWAEHRTGLLNEEQSTEILAWVRLRTKSTYSRWHFANSLRRFFNWARDEKKALPLGSTEADLVVMPKPKPPVIEIYTPAEMQILLCYAETREERAVVVLGGFVGLRSSEVTGDRTKHGPLTVEDILFAGNAVRVTQKVQQQSTERFPPLLPNALSWLEEWREERGPLVSFEMGSEAIQRIIERANTAGEKITFKRNGLRRSYISYRTAITRDVPRVADECNTSPAKIRKNYRRPGLEGPAHEYFGLFVFTPLRFGPRLSTGGARREVLSEGS